MGVTGLWGILEPSGKPVRIQTLKGKVLSVDVSIWLHQSVKGFRDKDGNPLRNAHLLGVFHRVCKLLSYGIKPVFVFDGGVPALKKQTMTGRRQRKLEAQDKSAASRKKLIQNLLKQQLQRQYLTTLPESEDIDAEIDRAIQASESTSQEGESAKKRVNQKATGRKSSVSRSPQKSAKNEFDEDFEKFREKLAENYNNFSIFMGELDAQRSMSSSDFDEEDFSDSEVYMVRDKAKGSYDENFDSILKPDFDEMPLEVQHEMLFEMQEARKNNSWGRMDQMPKSLKDFSSFQMERLRKRQTIQTKIKTVQKEMGQRHIHLSNFDELADLDLGEKDETKTIIALQKKNEGLLYVKKTGQKSTNESDKSDVKVENSGPSSSVAGNNEFQGISFEDYVITGDWTSSEDEGKDIKPKESTEEEQLQLALKMSLEEGVVESIPPEDSKTNTPETKSEPNEEEELQLAIKMSLEEEAQLKLRLDMPQVTSKECKESSRKNANKKIARGKSKSVSLKRSHDFRKSVITRIPPNSSKKKHSKQKESSSRLSPLPLMDTPSVPNSDSGPTAMEIPDDDSGSPIQSPPDSSSDFEDVGSEAASETKSNSAVGSILKNISVQIKSPAAPVLTIAINADEKFDEEEDIFADIFCVDEKPGADREGGDSSSEVVEVSPKELMTNIIQDKIYHPIEGVSPKNSNNVEREETSIVSLSESDSDFEMLPEQSSSIGVGPHNISAESNEDGPKITRTLGVDPSKSVRMISAQYMQAQEKLNEENQMLKTTKGFQERLATSITDQMYSDAQELLSLFGVPYVISPMEAEAQCAFFDTACLTEGTITEDSDVWLFGGQRVYKNFFSAGDRPLELFQYTDVVTTLNLDRDKMILIAILTGSDYTDGIEGVGPVKALEILSEFPSPTISALDSLVTFKEWWDKAQKDKKLDVENKIRNKFRKLKIRQGFPNPGVYDAYVNPTVDESLESFSWGKPDVDSLRKYIKEKFGWNEQKCDAALFPLTKMLACQIEETKRQLSMDAFITFGGPKLKKRKVKSKRLAQAMKKLKGKETSKEVNLSTDDSEESATEATFPSTSSKTKSEKAPRNIASRNIPSRTANIDSPDSDDGELESLLIQMGVKRLKTKPPTATVGNNVPGPSNRGRGRAGRGHSLNSLPQRTPSSPGPSPSSSASTSTPVRVVTTPVKKPEVVPQKAREEFQRQMNKKKAIEILKNKKK